MGCAVPPNGLARFPDGAALTQLAAIPAARPCPAGYERLRPYVAFHAALRSAFQAFVHGLEERCKGIVRHHLETATSEYAIGLLAGERAHAAGIAFLVLHNACPAGWDRCLHACA